MTSQLSKFIILLLICLINNYSYSQNDKLADFNADGLTNLSLIHESDGYKLVSDQNIGAVKLHIDSNPTIVNFINGKAPIELSDSRVGNLYFFSYQTTSNKSQYKLYHVSKRSNGSSRIKNIPLWLSILPPIIAIVLALVFKEVIVSLMAGIWAGSFIAGGLRLDSIYWLFISFLDTVKKYLINAVSDSDHVAVILFSLLIGGMVAIISKNGGMTGIVMALSKYAKTPKSAQLITWMLGVAIFFDDYANTLIVGNTMRSVTDKFRISREKLAYIVDSTSAPVAAVFFITTWIGAELGYIGDGLDKINLGYEITPYAVFLSSLKYSFYPILTLIFMFILIKSGKEYGPMYTAEMRARKTGQVSPAKSNAEDEPDMEDLSPVNPDKIRWYNAAIPVATVILVTIFGLLDTGLDSLHETILETSPSINANWGSIWSNLHLVNQDNPSLFAKLGLVIGASNSFTALLYASLMGVIVASILTVSQRIISLFDTMHYLVVGFKTMMPAIIILSLAWALAITTDELHTADYLSSTLEHAINPYLLPVVIFIMAAFIAFSTGSSWSTMAILYPIAIPTTYAICQANGLNAEISFELILNVIATVLAASVLGDHCSPISDTTILSSLASDCNHLDHVKTQMPYALTVGVISMVAVGLSTLLGGGWLISLLLIVISSVLMYLFVRWKGKDIDVANI